MLLAYDWHVAQVVCETRIIISYVSNSLVPNSLIAASYCTQRSIKVSQKRSNWDFTYKSISHIRRHFLSNKVLSEEPKDGPDFEASLGYHNYAVRKVRCCRPFIFGGGLQVPRQCVQQCNTLQQFSNSPKGVQDKFEDGLMKAQNCPKLSANCAG